MIFEKNRFEIWTQAQHPYKHSLTEFYYGHPALPGITNVESAMNYMLAVLYPQTKTAVATVAALPSSGNTLNDFRVVTDDGDGKAAGYRWEQREGEVAASWHKIYDMDWGIDSILTQFHQQAQAYYVFKQGNDDLDATGTAITGTFAGQRVFGGVSASTNLTLSANSGDGVGADTGFVQTTDHLRPTTAGTLDLGTSALKFRSLYLGTSGLIGTLTAASGSITDSSGAISFNDENLSTTGTLASGTHTVSGTMAITGTTIIASGGTIGFSSNTLTTTGPINGSVLTGSTSLKTGTMTLTGGNLADSSGALSFNALNLTTSGFMHAGAITGTQLDIDNIRLDLNTISTTNTNGVLTLAPNGTGTVDVTKGMTTVGVTTTGTLAVTGLLTIDNLSLDANTLASTNTNGAITISPAGTGTIGVTAAIIPGTDNVKDLGDSTHRFRTLYFGTSISDGTNAVIPGDLFALRNTKFRDAARSSAVQNGDALFYDSTSGTWLASAPDTEIAHGALSGLTTSDAGHTQFVMLNGRSGGQTVYGGTAGGEHLILESTFNASKGWVKTSSSFVPTTTAAYSAGWTGTDLGATAQCFNNLFLKGEAKGLRFENFATGSIPAFSAQNVGRIMFDSTLLVPKIDTGAAIKTLAVIDASQVLTNKDFDGGTASNTSRITMPSGTKTALDALTRKTGTIVYATDQAKPYFDNGTALVAVGSGSGGGKNYITGGDGESGSIGTVYNDAAAVPVDGVGGSAGCTFATTSTNPLTGNNSLLYTPSATLGQGVAISFTLDREDFAQVLQGQVSYELGSYANYTDGDLQFWIIAPSGAVIQPAGYKLIKASGTAKTTFTFQTESTGTTYKLLIHQTTTTTTWTTCKFELALGPQVKEYGPYISDWVAFTPTFASGVTSIGTGQVQYGYWRRVGDSMELYYSYRLGTGVTITAATSIQAAMPTGYTIDTTKASANIGMWGHGELYDNSANLGYALTVEYASTSAFTLRSLREGEGTSAGITDTVPITLAVGDYISLNVKVPIVGWSSAQLLSADADTRVCAASCYLSSALSHTSTGNWQTNVSSGKYTALIDTHGGMSTSGQYTVLVPGIYRVTAGANLAANATGERIIRPVHARGGGALTSLRGTEVPGTAASATGVLGSIICNAIAGDTIYFEAYQNSGGSLAYNTGDTWMTVERLSGPAQIAASESVTCRVNTSSTTLAAAAATVIYTAKTYDSHGGYNTSTGDYVCPVAGKYRVIGSVYFAGTWVSGGLLALAIRKGSTDFGTTIYRMPASGALGAVSFQVVDEIDCLAGDTLKIRAASEMTAPTISAGATVTFATFSRIGN